MGTIILFLDSFCDIINYRVVWYIEGSVTTPMINNVSNVYTIFIDTLFIFFLFYILFTSIRRIEMGKHTPYAGKIIFSPKNRFELIALFVNRIVKVKPEMIIILAVPFVILGISFLLILMYFTILIPLFNYLIDYGVLH